MTNFATLQSDVSKWAAKSNLGPVIPSFIRLAEARINREIRTLSMQSRGTLVVPDTGEVALPARFLSFRAVSIQVPDSSLTDRARIDYMPPDLFDEKQQQANSFLGQQRTSFYTIEAGNIRLFPFPGAGETTTLRVSFYQAFEALSDTNITHSLITDNYDLYLMAALIEVWDYLQDATMEAKYHARYNSIKESIHASERGKHRSGPKIRMVDGVAP